MQPEAVSETGVLKPRELGLEMPAAGFKEQVQSEVKSITVDDHEKERFFLPEDEEAQAMHYRRRREIEGDKETARSLERVLQASEHGGDKSVPAVKQSPAPVCREPEVKECRPKVVKHPWCEKIETHT